MEVLYKFFQHPWFLTALLAVSVPLIIEWLLRLRRRRIPFAAMRYLMDTERPRKIRMQDRILLILRMIIIGLIVIAISRPLIRPENIISVDRSDRAVVVLMDATYSNAQRIGNASSFQHAKRMLRDILTTIPDGVNIAMGVLSQKFHQITDWTTDKPMLLDRLESIQVSHGSGSMREGLEWVLKKVKEKSSTTNKRCEVYIFSDMQKITWEKGEGTGTASARGLLQQVAQYAQVFVSATGGKTSRNIYVSRFEPVDKILAVGVTTEFEVQVDTANVPEGSSVPARLSFFVDGQKRHFEKVTIPSGGTTLRVPYVVLHKGKHLMKVVVEGDDSPLDNERMYLAKVPEAVKVLVLDDDADLPVPERRSVFWAFATAPPTAPGRERVSAFTVSTMTWEKAQSENFADYTVIVLANVKEPTEGLVSRLSFYVREGGTLITFTGERVEEFPYERMYRTAKGLLPAMFGEKKKVSAVLKTVLPLVKHLDEGKILYTRTLKQSDTVKDAEVIATLSTGEPMIIARKYGHGKTAVVAMDPGIQWSLLPFNVDFPVFVQELLRSVTGDPNKRINLKVGDTFSEPVLIPVPHLLVKKPNGERIRINPQDVEGENTQRIVFNDTDVQGMYKIEAPPGVIAEDDFVVNLNPDEADMSMWDESSFRSNICDQVVWLTPTDNITKRVEAMYSMREFAGMILFLVFLLLLLELFLATRFGLRKG